MVKIICDSKEEKEGVDRLLRMGKLTAMTVEIILKVDEPCFDYKKSNGGLRRIFINGKHTHIFNRSIPVVAHH